MSSGLSTKVADPRGILCGFLALFAISSLLHAAPAPPVIAPFGEELLYGPPDPFESPAPTLTQGTPPITWSLIGEPLGMEIDPASGVFSWLYPEHIGDFWVTLKATNAAGSNELDIFIIRKTTATIPINPIDERTIYITPQSSAGDGLGPSAPGAVLTPPPGSDYSGIRLEFPGYVEVAIGDPPYTVVTLRAAGIYDRAGFGGQSFPNQSGAVFVVETESVTGSQVVFTDPVNMTVPFVDRPKPSETDVVTLESASGEAIDMRLCWDQWLGPGADFVFIDRLQAVDPTAGTITVEGVTPLTDSQGLGVWGAAVNPHSPSAEVIVGDLLGTAPFTGPNRPTADCNADGLLDSADVVTRINQ